MAITFDDGYTSAVELGLPALRGTGAPATVRETARKLGYRGAVTTARGTVGRGDDIYALRRVELSQDLRGADGRVSCPHL